MSVHWSDEQPIYRQLRDRIVALILDEYVKGGDPLPSVRKMSTDYQVNHLTVSKAYQILVDEGLIEKKRGLGMFILDGAKERVLERERSRFIDKEWPQIVLRIQRLGLDVEKLLRDMDYFNGEGK